MEARLKKKNGGLSVRETWHAAARHTHGRARARTRAHTCVRAHTHAHTHMSYLIPHLANGWEVDQAILSEEERVVIMRFGTDGDATCMLMDEVLAGIMDKIKNFAGVERWARARERERERECVRVRIRVRAAAAAAAAQR